MDRWPWDPGLGGLGIEESTYVEPTPTPTPAPKPWEMKPGWIYHPNGVSVPVRSHSQVQLQAVVADYLTLPCSRLSVTDTHNVKQMLAANQIPSANVNTVRQKIALCERSTVTVPTTTKPVPKPSAPTTYFWQLPTGGQLTPVYTQAVVRPTRPAVEAPSTGPEPIRMLDRPSVKVDYTQAIEESELRRQRMLQAAEKERQQFQKTFQTPGMIVRRVENGVPVKVEDYGDYLKIIKGGKWGGETLRIDNPTEEERARWLRVPSVEEVSIGEEVQKNIAEALERARQKYELQQEVQRNIDEATTRAEQTWEMQQAMQKGPVVASMVSAGIEEPAITPAAVHSVPEQSLFEMKQARANVDARITATEKALEPYQPTGFVSWLFAKSSGEQTPQERALRDLLKAQKANAVDLDRRIRYAEAEAKKAAPKAGVLDAVLSVLQAPTKIAEKGKEAIAAAKQTAEAYESWSKEFKSAREKSAEAVGAQIEALKSRQTAAWDSALTSLTDAARNASWTFRETTERVVGAVTPSEEAKARVGAALQSFDVMLKRGAAELREKAPVIGAALLEMQRAGLAPAEYEVSYEEGKGQVTLDREPALSFELVQREGKPAVSVTPAPLSPVTEALIAGAVRGAARNEKATALDLNFVSKYIDLKTTLPNRIWTDAETRKVKAEIAKLRGELEKPVPVPSGPLQSNASLQERMKHFGAEMKVRVAQEVQDQVIRGMQNSEQVMAGWNALREMPHKIDVGYGSDREYEQARLAQQLYNAYNYRQFRNNIVDDVVPAVATKVAAEELPGREFVLGMEKGKVVVGLQGWRGRQEVER